MTGFSNLPSDFDEIIESLVAEAIPILVPTDNSSDRLSELDLAKRRAIELIEEGKLAEAWLSFILKLYSSRWRDRYFAPVALGTRLKQLGKLNTPESLTKFIRLFT